MDGYEVWIKEAKVRQFGHLEEFALAYRVKGPTFDRIGPPDEPKAGPAVSLIVQQLAAILADIPPGSEVHLICDQAAITGAWTQGWLEGWKAKGFRDKPTNPDAWKALSNTIDATALHIVARSGTKTESDKAVMAQLTRLLHGKREPHPGDPEEIWHDANLEEKQLDALRQRAMEKDN